MKGIPNHWTTLQKLIWLQVLQGGGGGGELVTVTGISPLALANALAKPLKSLTQYGKCTQSSTPTPDAPVDIMCNNGAVKMLNLANMAQSNLDIGYYIDNSGTRKSSISNFYTLGYIPVKASTAYTMKTSGSLNYFNVMEYDAENGFIQRTLYGSSSNPAGDTTTFTTGATTAFIRFGSNINGGILDYDAISAFTWMLTEGATAMDYVPFGEWSVIGTPEVLTVRGKNLLNTATNVEGYYISASGVISQSDTPDAQYTDLIPVTAGETYTWSLKSWRTKNNSTNRWHGYNSSGTWVRQIAFETAPMGGELVTLTAAIPSGVAYVRLSYGITDTEAMLEKSATKTDYQPYTTQTVTNIPDLFAVGDYADTVDIISGGVVRRCGIKVFDGTESIGLATGTFRCTIAGKAPNAKVLCSHFDGNVDPSISVANMPDLAIKSHGSNANIYFKFNAIETAAEFKAWLAAQYAAGTPVIVIYPLAEEQTEQTTGHALHSYEGTTVVEAKTNVDPVTLSAEYMAGAA